MAKTDRSGHLITNTNPPTPQDLANIVYDIQTIPYLVSSATFTFTQVNTCNATPLTIATPSAPSKTMLPIAFYYTQGFHKR